MSNFQENASGDNSGTEKQFYIDVKKIASNEFGIHISVQKMCDDPDYKKLVLSELKTLDHKPLNELLGKLEQQKAKAPSEEKIQPSNRTNTIPTKKVKRSKNKNNNTLISMLGCSLLLAFAAIYYLLQPNNEALVAYWDNAFKAEEITQQVDQKQLEKSQIPPPVKQKSSQEPILNFRLHGSNTIGEHLGPALIEAFITKRGGKELKWQKTSNTLEKSLQYKLDNQLYTIEVHSHGSSTGFKSLGLNRADIGMSSRQAKTKEVNALKDQLGQLNKLGNEHIIGLDGLAIIVNQNNPIHGLSINTLAKIYSGEINNWVDIGGPDLPIKLYSRDINSGTWDTFNKLVLKKSKRSLSPGSTRLESSTSLSNKVSQDDAAIGFIGLNYINHNKALSISEGSNSLPIYPTRFTISTEDYALSRRLYFYTPTSASTEIKDFARFAISKQGQNIVEEVGLVSQNIKIETVYPIPNAPKSYNGYANSAKRLSMNFYFNNGNKELDNKGMRDLDRLLEFVENNPSRRLILMGFSDNIGALKNNRQLSYNRAKEVEKQLSSRGLPVMAVEGFGELLPIANNETQIGRERNRRVEIWVQ